MIKKENESVLRELRRVERNYEERCENNNNKVNSFSPESDRVFKSKILKISQVKHVIWNTNKKIKFLFT